MKFVSGQAGGTGGGTAFECKIHPLPQIRANIYPGTYRDPRVRPFVAVLAMGMLLTAALSLGALVFSSVHADGEAQLPKLVDQGGGDLTGPINAYRQSKGLQPFAVSAALTCGAQSWVNRVAANGGNPPHDSIFATIARLQACGDPGTFTGEIEEGNSGLSSADTLTVFENSPEHNSIILGPGNAMGCAHAVGSFNGFSPFDFYICDFASEPGSVPSSVPGPSPTPNPSPVPGPCAPPLCGSTAGGSSSGGTTPPPTSCVPPLCGSTGFPAPSGGTSGTTVFQCIPPTCASTQPQSSSGGAPASTGNTPQFVPGLPASTGGSTGTSTSGGAAAGTAGTQCNPPLCASTR